MRFNAALDLAAGGRADGVDVLVEALGHDWGVVRRSFARPALARLGARVVATLERAAGGDGTTAVGAAIALAEIDGGRTPDLLPVVRRALAGGDGAALEDALAFLWERPQAVAPLTTDLLALAASDDGDSADEAWAADPRVAATLVVARAVGDQGHVHDALTALLARGAAVLRWAGALALGHAGRSSDAAIRGLAGCARAEDERAEVRVAVAYALARLADPGAETLPVLRSLLDAGTRWVRIAALRILGELAAAEPRSYAADELYVCFFSAHPVARLVDASAAVPLVAAALRDEDANIRRNAVLALAWCGEVGSGAVTALCELLGEPYFGPLAAEALARVGEPARAPLAAARRSASPAARAHAAYGLELLDGSERRAFEPPVDDFYLRVPIEWTRDKLAAFEELYERTVARAPAPEVDYDVPYPRHEFLRYLCDVRRLMLHGSERGDLEVLKPLRSSTDSAEHGNVSGVYGEPDPIRPIYFAVVERSRSFGLMNACFALRADGAEDSRLDDPHLTRYYRLSIGVPGLERDVWRSGTVYALPRDTFEFWEEWTSRVPVRPLLRLAVDADDLPLKDALWGADLRKPGSIWVDPREPFPYLEDVWALPIRT